MSSPEPFFQPIRFERDHGRAYTPGGFSCHPRVSTREFHGASTRSAVVGHPRGAGVPRGLLVHIVDQALHFRAGPIPILVTAPTVAVFAYGYARPDTIVRRLLALAGWCVVGSGLALLGMYLHAVSYRLPRPMTEPEMALYDLGLFCWFVASLTGIYVLAARRGDQNRRALVAIASAPLLQLAWILAVVVLVEGGRYG